MKTEVANHRDWCFTLNNWTESEYNEIVNYKYKYLIIGKEVGQQGTPHLQGYIEFNSGKQLKVLKKHLCERIHWEPRKGTKVQALEYCKKDKNFTEFGTPSSQGKRTDLLALRDEINNGRTVQDIRWNDPLTYHQYGRTLEALENDVNKKKWRKKMTKGIWYWGPTGSGKSYRAFQNYTPETHYNVPNDHGWWDNYCGQETVILNDFRGEIPYNKLLDLCDEWPCEINRRNRPPLPFTSSIIIVTSSLHPSMVYNRRAAEDSLEQLFRRFTIIKCEKYIRENNENISDKPSKYEEFTAENISGQGVILTPDFDQKNDKENETSDFLEVLKNGRWI